MSLLSLASAQSLLSSLFSRQRVAGRPQAASAAARKWTAPAMSWRGDHHLSVGDTAFILSVDTAELQRGLSGEDAFLIGKSRAMIDRAILLADAFPVDRIFEMGILHGGSVALYDRLFSPRRMVAIDLSPSRVDRLDRYIQRQGRSEAIRPVYGLSQDDASGMNALLGREFPGRDIDLIIDDASHLYEPTRAAFNLAFPYLAPGGLYVIEDWAWAHWQGDYWQNDNAYFSGKPALSNLVIELMMLSASRPDLIAEVHVDAGMVTIRKGEGRITSRRFDLADHYLLRGMKFVPSF